MGIIYALITAVAVLCAYLLVENYLGRRRHNASVTTRIAPDGTRVDIETFESIPIAMNSEPTPGARRLLGILRMLGVDVETSSRQLERRFAQAGIVSPNAAAYYLFAQRIGGVAALALALLLVVTAKDNTALLSYGMAIMLTVVGLFGPQLYLKNATDKRKQTLQRAFPDTLDLLLICVESGLALDASLARVCSELGHAYPEMTIELNRTRMELALLNDRVRALVNLGERTDMPAFRALISSLIQSERFGTSLIDTLRVLSEEFRLQRLADAEVKAARLPVYITLPLIFLLMPAFFLIVLGPAIVRVVHNTQYMTSE